MGVSLEDGWQPSSRTHHHGTCARVSCRQRAGWSPRRALRDDLPRSAQC